MQADDSARRYLRLVLQAHARSALAQPNLSTQVILALGSAQVPFPQAVAGAVSSLGGIHGPTDRIREFLFRVPAEEQDRWARDKGRRVPGFGNSFHRDRVDPAWEGVEKFLRGEWPEVAATLDRVAGVLRESRGRPLFPNPGSFTAVAAEKLDLPRGTETAIVIQGRIMAWANLYGSVR